MILRWFMSGHLTSPQQLSIQVGHFSELRRRVARATASGIAEIVGDYEYTRLSDGSFGILGTETARIKDVLRR